MESRRANSGPIGDESTGEAPEESLERLDRVVIAVDVEGLLCYI